MSPVFPEYAANISNNIDIAAIFRKINLYSFLSSSMSHFSSVQSKSGMER